MGYSLPLTILGMLLIAAGLLHPSLAPVLVWLGFNFVVLGAGHALGWHRVFGKRQNGTLPLWGQLLFLPLLVFTKITWSSLVLVQREAPWNQITDNVFIGRRLRPGETDQTFDNFVDLTAEFSEPRVFRTRASYVSFPILDGGAPLPHDLHQAIASLKPGRTFIHCAQGHGRSGTFAAALLLHSGVVSTVDDALRIITTARPGIRLTAVQRKCLRHFQAVQTHGADK